MHADDGAQNNCGLWMCVYVDLGRRRRRPTTNQLSWLAGPHASERAMRSVARHCQMRISVAERKERAREGGNRQLCQNSNEPQTLFSFRRWRTGRLARLVFVHRTSEIIKPLPRTRECVSGPKRNDGDSERIDRRLGLMTVSCAWLKIQKSSHRGNWPHSTRR